jgi:hypothetical protein
VSVEASHSRLRFQCVPSIMDPETRNETALHSSSSGPNGFRASVRQRRLLEL